MGIKYAYDIKTQCMQTCQNPDTKFFEACQLIAGHTKFHRSDKLKW